MECNGCGSIFNAWTFAWRNSLNGNKIYECGVCGELIEIKSLKIR